MRVLCSSQPSKEWWGPASGSRSLWTVKCFLQDPGSDLPYRGSRTLRVLTQACCILMASSTSSLSSSLRLHRLFIFFSVGDLESDICDAWPLSVSITLWVFIGYQFCVLHLFEDLSGRAWHLFLLCVCRAWLPSYLGGDPVRAGVWKGETGEIGVRPVRHSSWAHLLWQEGHLFFRFCLLEPVFVLSYWFSVLLYLKHAVTTWTKESVGEGLPEQVKLSLESSETSCGWIDWEEIRCFGEECGAEGFRAVQTSPLSSAEPLQSISFGLTLAFLCGLLSASCYLPYPQEVRPKTSSGYLETVACACCICIFLV